MNFIANPITTIKGYQELASNIDNGTKSIYIHGLIKDSLGHFLYSLYINEKKNIFVVTEDDISARKLYENIKDDKNAEKIMESYVRLTENWYIKSYDGKIFESMDWEKLNKEELVKKYTETEKNPNFSTKYQTLALLEENWLNPKKEKDDKIYEQSS